MRRAAAAACVAVLLAAPAWAQPEEDELKYPLLYAAGEGDAERVRELLAQGADPNKELSPHGETPLHTAAIKGDPTVTSLLLNAGAVVDARTPPGGGISMTPLM